MGASRILAAVFNSAIVAGCGGGNPIGPMPQSGTPRGGSSPFIVSIDALANRPIVSGTVPSLEIGKARRGQTIFDRAYGSRSLAPAVAADTLTDYQIASLTKAFTAASILLLAQDGSLSIDDSLARYVPEYPPAALITLRQMLNMVSGMPSDSNDGFTTLYGSIDHESVVRRLATFPLEFAPGTRFEPNRNATKSFLACRQSSR